MLLFTRLTLVTQILDSYYAIPHAQKTKVKGFGKNIAIAQQRKNNK